MERVLNINLEVRRYHGRGCHYHDHVQVLVPLQGVMKVAIEGASGIVTGRTVAVIPKGYSHDFVPSGDCNLLVADVELREDEGQDAPALLRGDGPFVSHVQPWLWRIFRQIGAEIDADGRCAHDAAMLALSGLHLIRPTPVPKPQSKASSRIECIAANLGTRNGKAVVGAMAREAGLSQSHFHALFKAATGRSPRQYEIDQRLDAAVERLIFTRDSISEIAYAAGYENVSAFSRLFKGRFGMSPGAFRVASSAERS